MYCHTLLFSVDLATTIFNKKRDNRIQDRNAFFFFILTKSRVNIQKCYSENLTANPLAGLNPMSTGFGLPNNYTNMCMHTECIFKRTLIQSLLKHLISYFTHAFSLGARQHRILDEK